MTVRTGIGKNGSVGRLKTGLDRAGLLKVLLDPGALSYNSGSMANTTQEFR